jgi:hypothetical protein
MYNERERIREIYDVLTFQVLPGYLSEFVKGNTKKKRYSRSPGRDFPKWMSVLPTVCNDHRNS